MTTTGVNTRFTEIDGKALFKNRSVIENVPLDNDWYKQAFLLNDTFITDIDDVKNRYWSSASAKFTDTRLGGNIGINAPPQFTPYADVPVKGRLNGRVDASISDTTGNNGMGRYYSEAIDDNGQIIYLRFGVPQFNSLVNFLARAFDRDARVLAATGKTSSIFYSSANILGTIFSLTAAPLIAIPIFLGQTINSMLIRPTSKYYTLKPTMPNYWSAVQIVVNALCVNMGIYPKIVNETLGDDASKQQLGRPFKLDETQLTNLSLAMPEIFRYANSNMGLFDVYAIANHAQRIANQKYKDDYENLNKNTPLDHEGYVKRSISGNGRHATTITDDDGNITLASRLDEMFRSKYYRTDSGDQAAEIHPSIDPVTGLDRGSQMDPVTRQEKTSDGSFLDGFWPEFRRNLDAEIRDGSEFAIFKVDHTGSVQESFSNATGESDISQKLNGLSSQARQFRFTLAEGNVAGDAVSSVAGAISDLAMGALDGVTMGFSSLLSGLAGSGYIDIPKHWQSSSANLSRSTYTMKLISPYGNAYSRIQNIMIPLAMIMAGTLPLSAGKQSYVSPFICQLFDRGRSQIRLGMIESLSITRGTSNLPFNSRGEVLALDVSFTIADLSSIMHMPVTQGNFLGHSATLDEDNILTDYLAVLAGQDIYSQIYALPKAKLNLAKWIADNGRYTSAAHWASFAADSAAISWVEGLVRGSSLTAREGL